MDKRCYPIPEMWEDSSKLNRIERRIFYTIIPLGELDKLDSTLDGKQWNFLLDQFSGKN